MRFEIPTQSFFDADAVIKALDKKTRRALSQFGAFVRRRARSSIRKARRKTLAELTAEERTLWEIKKRVAQREGFKPLRPLKHSEPGDPPRSINGLLRRMIFFSYEPQNVVIGPVIAGGGTGAPQVLEYGGSTTGSEGGTVRIEARPYMRPAFEAELPQVPRLLAR